MASRQMGYRDRMGYRDLRTLRSPERMALSLIVLVAVALGSLAMGAVSGTAFASDGSLVEVNPQASRNLREPVVRLKDISHFDGVRDNQLYGLGLVVGLNGTGDGTGSQANVQMVANMLNRLGITVSQDQMKVKNVAAVMVTATLPPFARPGDRVDVTVSSFGDAKSLQGGFLLQTPLQGADGNIYVVAQGPVSIGGFGASSTGGSSQTKNHLTVGSVPGGGIVEATVPTEVVTGGEVRVVLNNPDFSTAYRAAQGIDQVFGPGTAVAENQSTISVKIPEAYSGDTVKFLAALEQVTITPDTGAKVVVNERTGTVIIGHNVRISTVAVAHGGLSVRIASDTSVSQPPPLSEGQTVAYQTSEVSVEEEAGKVVLLESESNVEDLVAALNAVGASPRDIISVLQAIKAAGALYGELEII